MERNIIKRLYLIGYFALGMNVLLMAGTENEHGVYEKSGMERWKQSPHSMSLSGGALLAPESYKLFTKMPALNFSLAYNYDIPWHHKRTNFFVTAGMAYEGCRRDDKPYQAKNGLMYERFRHDSYHIDFGAGLNIRLAYFLELSFTAAIDVSLSFERWRYPSFYGVSAPPADDFFTDTYYAEMGPKFGGGMRGLFSVYLTYEVKRIRIFAGCRVYVGHSNNLSSAFDYNADNPKGQPYNSWAVLGVGYRF